MLMLTMKTAANLILILVIIIIHSEVLGFHCNHATNIKVGRESSRAASSTSQQNTTASIASNRQRTPTVQNPLSNRRIQIAGPKYNELMKEGGWIQHEGTLKRLDFEALSAHQQGQNNVSFDDIMATASACGTPAEDWFCIEPSIVSQNENVPLDEDKARQLKEQLLFVNKPSGINCVPARDPSINSLSSQITSLYGKNSKPCHRLDRDTSGLVVFGLMSDVHRDISKQFEARTTLKTYVALIAGHPKEDGGIIDLPIGKIKTRDGFNRWTIGGDKARQSITAWSVDERFTDDDTKAKWSRVQLSPKTGRGQQLRLHMKAIGHPILGDSIHAEGGVASCSPRLCLHAHKLQLDWNGVRLEAESVAPF